MTKSAGKKTQNQNRDFWDKCASLRKGHDVSWWDVNMKRLEIENIIPYLSANDHVLDIGCSNGASTVEIFKKTKCKIHGIDYSKQSIAQTKMYKQKKLSFECADILKYRSKIQYDKVVSIRCLINLMDENTQKQALENIHSLLKPHGLYIMAEAFYGGLENLNKARSFFGLSPLDEPAYNLYFREKRFEKYIVKYFNIKKIHKYSSLYYIGTRLFQYLLDDDPRGKDTALHRFFAAHCRETKHSGDFSPQKIYILEKKNEK